MTIDLRARAAALDAADPLAHWRDAFVLRDGLIYFDGNSLGALPKATAARVADTVTGAWGDGLISSWLAADWIAAPRRIGDKIAALLGANPGEVIAADSTSVNIFKALTAALSLRPDRRVIVTETGNFPTDLYMMQRLARLAGVCVAAVSSESLHDHLDDRVAAGLLTQVHYKTGAVHDLAATTRAVQATGALIIWDLSHSAGAIDVDLNAANADFAVGCGYKFFNGGPGAPGFVFAAARHHAAAPALTGWFGHARPFAFEDDYDPAPGIDRFQCGTPPILGLAALEAGVDLMGHVDRVARRAKSAALGELFIDALAALCGEFGFRLVSPRDPARRGSQVSFAHPDGYAMMQALKARDVIGDFRAPDIMRFGLTPLYLRHADIVMAVEILADICRSRAWDKPAYRIRAAVT